RFVRGPLSVAGCRLQVAGHRLQVTGCRLSCSVQLVTLSSCHLVIEGECSKQHRLLSTRRAYARIGRFGELSNNGDATGSSAGGTLHSALTWWHGAAGARAD